MFARFFDELGNGVIATASAGTGILLTAFGPAPLSRVVAEGLGIPSIAVYLAPAVPHPGVPTTGAGPLAAISAQRENLAAGRDQLRRAETLYAEPVARVRARLSLSTAPTQASTNPGGAPPGWPVCHGFSPGVQPRSAKWPHEGRVSGRPDGRPPASSSTSCKPGQGELLSDIAAAAAKHVSVRAVVQSGWAGLTASDDDTLLVGDLPHDWLSPARRTVVHHAGAGTTGAGLHASIPAVPVPVLVDQPFWATRLHHLGVAPRPIALPDLSTDTLADALRSCLSQPGYRDRGRRT